MKPTGHCGEIMTDLVQAKIKQLQGLYSVDVFWKGTGVCVCVCV